MRVENRDHLGPHEVEVDNDVYGVMLVGRGTAVMAGKLFNTKNSALKYAETFGNSDSYVVKITGTHS